MKRVRVIRGPGGELLRRSGLTDFDTLWSWSGQTVDAPNRRGEGFSSVSRHRLAGADDQARFYRKRQQDYFPRSRLGGRELLLWREYRALTRFSALGIDCPDVAAVMLRSDNGHRQGVLVTAALQDHVPLDHVMARCQGRLPDRVVESLARYLRRMHAKRLFHGNLYPKHLYVHREALDGRPVDDPVRVIDLEDARRVPWARYAMVRDLEKLNRYTQQASDFRRLRFFLRYWGARRLTRGQRRVLAAIVARGRKRPGAARRAGA